MLTGKIALVTGAGRGIGRQIALTLAQNHAHVIVNYNGSKQNAEQVVAEITQAGGSAEAIQCNVADADAGNAMVKDILAKHGKVDILVNNAGITRDNLIMRMTDQDAAKSLLQMIPMGKAGTAQNVADLVLFLAGSGSDYITGQVIGVNGGMAMQ